MFTLFSNQYRSRGLISKHPTTDWMIARVAQNIELQKNYYASAGRSVFANHPIAQALKLIGANAKVDEFTLYDQAWTRSIMVGRSLGFTSEVNKGSALAHPLYKSDACSWVSYPEYISPYTAANDWKELEPVKVLWIDSNKMSTDVPSLNGDPVMFSTVTIDLPRLTIMYRGWLNDRRKIMASNMDAIAYGEENFVAMYVLPGMLRSQAAVSAVSATIALHNGTYEDTKRVNSSIYLPSYSDEFKKIAEYSLRNIKNSSKMQYIHVLQNLPQVTSMSAYDAMQLPDMIPTIQSEWALMVARLRIIMFLTEIGGSNGRRANQGYINELKRKAKALANTGIPYNVLSDELAIYVESCIRTINKL